MMTLEESVERENAIWGSHADTKDVWANRNLEWTFVALCDGDVAGFVYCQPRPYSGECVFRPDSKILEIVTLIVEKSVRSQGLGHELMDMVRQEARRQGFTHLRVYSASRRFDDILKFYRSCGFTPWYVEMTRGIEAEPAHPNDGQ
jgi:GNAT superfamily N-acetyltransferase